MNDLYLVRRDVLDRIHQNPNAVPVVYPDEFGAILKDADPVAMARDAVTHLGLPALSESALARLAGLDKARLVDDVKATRDLIGFLDRWGYDNASAESRAAWDLLWDGMRDWDNGKWNWPEIATGTALAALYCPPVEEPERVVIAHGSTGH